MCARIQRWIFISATFFMATTTLVMPAEATNQDENHGLLILTDGGTEPAPVLGQMIHVRVTGIVARATVTQSFTNPTERHVEAVYVFPLPETAAVDELRIRVGDRVIEGEIKEKQEAKEIYQAAAEEGRKAVLLEQQRPNVFTASVTQIGPGESVEVEIEMQFDVDYDLGAFRLRFPMVVAPRYEANQTPALHSSPPAPQGVLLQPPVACEEVNPTALRVDVEAGFPVAEVDGGLHDILVRMDGERGFSVELADEIMPAAGDFVLEWRPQLGREPRVTSLVQELDGERYALVMVIPPVPEALTSKRLPREAVFVVDVSGSMGSVKLKQARQALLMGLAQLRIGDRFNVISFSDDLDTLFDTSREVDPPTLAEGRRYVAGLTIRGGTEILPAMVRALEDPDPESTMLRQVVFITDGQASDEERIFSEVRKRLGRSRLFTVGIGAAPNSYFMRHAAELGRGTFTFIDSIEQVAEQMSGLLRKLDAPVIQDIRVVWDDPAADAWPDRVGDLYLGEPLVLGARVAAGSGVTVSGWQRGKHMEVVLPLKGSAEASGLDKLWARHKIAALADERFDGADPEGVRARIVDLGLRHHLVTDFTSLVSADNIRTAPAREAPPSHLVSVNPIDNSVDIATFTNGLEETITVMSQSPLLDAKKITTGTTVTPIELEKLPSARDPWAAVAATPGVATDRVGAGANEAAPAQTLVGPGSTADDNVWSLDGVVITDMRVVSGGCPTYYNFDQYEEITVTTGGADVTQAHSGVTVDAVTRRGTNEMQLRSHYLGTGGAEEPSPAERDRIDQASDYGGSAGGPAMRDHLWIWGTYSRRDTQRRTLDGDRAEAVFEGGSAKLNAQPSSADSLSLSWNRGDVAHHGFDAGPARSPEAALDATELSEMWSGSANHVFSSTFFMDAALASSRRDGHSFSDASAPALWGRDGILQGRGRSGEERSESRQARLAGTSFFNLVETSHELTYGVERREVERSGYEHWEDGVLAVDGANLGTPGTDYFLLEATGDSAAERTLDSLWLQDIWDWNDRLVLTTGLRYDHQHGELESTDAEAVEWRTLVPRLGVSVPIGDDDRTLIRASWSRFAQQLGHDLVVRPDPSAHGKALFRSNGEGDVLVDDDGLFRPHRNDPGLEAALTDELFIGLEQAIGYSAALSLHLVHRTRSGVHELRDLVLDEAMSSHLDPPEGTDSGEVRLVEVDDYVLDHFTTGTLPDGSAYSVPVYSLGPAVSDAGARLLTNGDRKLEYDGVSIRFVKRFHGFWMARAEAHYGEQTWRLGPEWRRHHDPTDLLGSGDDDGALYVERPGDVDLGTSPWVQSTWSANLTGLVRLFPYRPWSFDLAASLHARQGNPLPYFVWDLASADGLPRRVQVSEEVDTFRTGDGFVADLRLEKEVRLVAWLDSVWSFDVLNLFDEDAALRRELNLSGARGGLLEETVASRVFRFGVRLSWN